MTNPVTPNIGLNKIDRTSPSTTYFDLEKYIDQNADAVDRFAGETSESIEALEKRLDTEERREVVLHPGLQIVNAERSAPFKLSGIKGRTLVNLLGRVGGCESLTGWTARPSFASASLDTSYKESGTASIKITQTKEGQVYARTTPFGVRPNSNLVAISYIKNSLPNSYLYMRFTDGVNTIPGVKGNYVDFGNVGFAYRILTAVELGDRNSVMLDISNSSDIPVGSTYNIDSVRVYEISAAEYAALDGMTPEQVAAKYPYVDSVQPVRNPYAIRYGKNLLPPFYEWTIKDSYITSNNLSLGKATITISNSGTGIFSLIKVKAGQYYNFSVDSISTGARLRIGVNDGSSPTVGTFIADIHEGNKNQTIDIPMGVTELAVVFLNKADYSGEYPATFFVDAPMLTIGSTLKTFKPRENSVLALQTDLYADPVTGANADEVFEKDGKYFKIKKWSSIFKIGIDSLTIEDYALSTPSGGFPIGYKRIRVRGLIENPVDIAPGSLVKYDGTIVPYGQSWSDAKEQYVVSNNSGNYVLINAKNGDTGWGDNYTPTADEIKAYFLGWRMFDVNDGTTWLTPYNRTDGLNKRWAKIYCGVGTNGSGPSLGTVAGSGIALVPTVANDMGYTPYRLVYQLGTPTVEPILSEGMLAFIEGDNQIEVGTGMVLRENVKFISNGNGAFTYNSNVPGAEKARFMVKDFLELYENNKPIYGAVRTIRTISNGTTFDIPSEKFNPTSA
ncbi:hypothetical protein P0100_22635, partial [Yersinia pestis]|nr:hypothetical protein [Yersinia pestis]